MVKNLKVRAIGIIILSAILFVLPIGAVFANKTMTSPVFAAEDTEGSEDPGAASDNETSESTSEETSDETGKSDDEGDGSDSASDNDAGDENGEGEGDGDGDGEDTDPEPVKLTCTCTEHCAGLYSYNANCEACSADYKNCEFVNPNVVINISVPDGWFNDKAKVTISVRDAKDTGNFDIVKIEAKIGQNGSWQDITEDRFIEITENCSVYVQVTDQNGKLYSKNRSIRCFDRTNPTLNAAVSNGLLTVVGYDNDSGIKAFYVNGYEFTDFTNNTLNIRLQQFDTGYEYFTVQAMDNSGNMSEVYKTKNPYYDDDPSDDDDKGASTLPTDATASNPSSATANVTEHTKTDSQGNTTYSSTQAQQKHQSMAEADAAEEAEKNQNSDDEEVAETGKEFYTIQTQSEKVFYLIIDRDGEEEKVYFLTEIDENDLMNTISTTSETLPKNSAALESAIPTSESALSNNNTESEVTVSTVPAEEEIVEETEEPVEEEPEVEESKKQNNMFTYIIMGIIGAGAIGAWYYLKMVKGKKEDFLDEDDEEDDEEEYYESDDDDSEGGGEDDFFKMDDDDVMPGVPVEDAEMDVADTIDDEE